MDQIVLTSMPREQLAAIVRHSVERALKDFQEESHITDGFKQKNLTKKETAEYLNCSVSKIDDLRRRGLLTRIRLGRTVRFKISELDALIENKKGSIND